MAMFEKPMGGTELMFEELKRRLPDSVWGNYSIFNYLSQADFTKKTIYWNQLSWDQQAVQFLKDRDLVEKIDHFVFVSHWQAEQFRQRYNIPGYKTHVLKNASLGVETRPVGPRSIVKLCYTSTPWRGLNVLLRAWEILQPRNCELHVFSSCHIYGPEFGKSDAQYAALYEKCRATPGIVYRGSIPNPQLRGELPNFDLLAYPCTFEETSCIAVIEALSAGLRVVCSNLGALPETTEGWARLYPYLMDHETHARRFSTILSSEIEKVRDGGWDSSLQAVHYSRGWSWDERIKEWVDFFHQLANELDENF
jgi:glycosyltransferase involved in cell wall biosynthesis